MIVKIKQQLRFTAKLPSNAHLIAETFSNGSQQVVLFKDSSAAKIARKTSSLLLTDKLKCSAPTLDANKNCIRSNPRPNSMANSSESIDVLRRAAIKHGHQRTLTKTTTKNASLAKARATLIT